jgi:ubiquinone/menaquinone biosynthesis C-methylase UbiE
MNEALDSLDKRLSATRCTGVDPVTRIFWDDQLKLVDRLVIGAMSKNKCRILDVGCGQGNRIISYSKLGFQCTGIDPLLKTSLLPALANAREQKADISLVSGAGEFIPFKDGAFDLVLCLSTLQHVKDQQKTLLEMKRVLDSQGTMIITIPTYRNASTLFRFKHVPDYVTKGYDLGTFSDEIEKARLRTIELIPFGLFPPKYFGLLQKIERNVGQSSIRKALQLSYRMGRICPSGASSLIAVVRPD